jgi:uncharacterized membrane protein YbhN (UPF0104 family)
MKWLGIAVKIAITGTLTWLLLKHVDFSAAGALLRSGRGVTALALAVAVLMVQAALAALRMDWLMRLLGTRCALGQGFAVWMIGLLVSQTLLTFIAGDAARIWQLIRRGHGRRVASSAIVLERALGFAVLLAMVLACEPVLLAQASSAAVHTGLMILAALCMAGIAAFAGSAFLGAVQNFLPPWLRQRRLIAIALDIASVARHLGGAWKLATAIVVASAVMHLGNVLAIFILAQAAGVDVGFIATAAVALPAMLVTLLPIALAGWGVREGSMIVGYGLFGVAPAIALAVSIAFGLTMLIASLPGVFFIRLAKREQTVAPA